MHHNNQSTFASQKVNQQLKKGVYCKGLQVRA
jgi:hypothetical protein